MVKIKEKTETKAITFRIGKTAKIRAEQMLDDMAINITTCLVSSVKALIREKRIPFDMVTLQCHFDHEIVAKLIETKREANDRNIQWFNHEEVLNRLGKNIIMLYNVEFLQSFSWVVNNIVLALEEVLEEHLLFYVICEKA